MGRLWWFSCSFGGGFRCDRHLVEVSFGGYDTSEEVSALVSLSRGEGLWGSRDRSSTFEYTEEVFARSCSIQSHVQRAASKVFNWLFILGGGFRAVGGGFGCPWRLQLPAARRLLALSLDPLPTTLATFAAGLPTELSVYASLFHLKDLPTLRV